jgi:hypothetical protein
MASPENATKGGVYVIRSRRSIKYLYWRWPDTALDLYPGQCRLAGQYSDLIEADPIAPGPSLTCSQQGVRLSGVNYAFDFSVNNLGAAGLYNVEVSAN